MTMTTREDGTVPERRWLDYLPFIVGALVLGLMGWGLFVGISSLVRTFRPTRPANASIALSAGFVRPSAPPESVAPTGEAAATSVLATPAAATGSSGEPASSAGEEGKPAIKTKVKEKEKAKEPPAVFEIRGSVQRSGQPVQRGKVRLTVSLVGERFRQSTLTDLDAKGEFKVSDHAAFQILKRKDRIRVLAEVWPARGGSEPLTETIYLNHHLPSWIRSSTGYGVLGGVMLFWALFLWAFTGRSTYDKNRLAIILSYGVIFISLAGALVGPTLLMLAVPDLPDISGKVPVGLVVARLTEDSKPEWMLNLGGYVDSGDAVAKSGPFRGDDAPASGEDLSSPVLRVVTLNGGIQIPLYVILLALIGGAINMTRQVPLFQSRQPVHPSLFHRMGWRRDRAPAAPKDEQQDDEEENAPWRKGLLEQYMFLVAAPFLAIATYYLLILLGTIQPPIIVLVSFSIGLISDTVVNAITGAAKKLLGGKQVKEEPAGQPSSAQPEPRPKAPAEALTVAAEADSEDAAKPKRVA